MPWDQASESRVSIVVSVTLAVAPQRTLAPAQLLRVAGRHVAADMHAMRADLDAAYAALRWGARVHTKVLIAPGAFTLVWASGCGLSPSVVRAAVQRLGPMAAHELQPHGPKPATNLNRITVHAPPPRRLVQQRRSG